MYIPSRTLNVVDVYDQYQYVHKSSRQNIAMCLMVQYLNNLDTEDLIIFTNLLARSDNLATATEGFDR